MGGPCAALLLLVSAAPLGGAIPEPPWADLLTDKFSPLVPLLNSLGRQVEEFYEIDLSVPAKVASKRPLKLKLKLVKGPLTRHLKLSYPREFPACVAAAA